VKRTVLPLAAGCIVIGLAVVRLEPIAAQHTAEPRVLVSREAYLMGTRAHLMVHARGRQEGLAQLDGALDTLEAVESELSTWRETSAVSALNRQPIGKPWRASQELCRTFADVWSWHRETNGAFDPGIGKVLAAWDVHGEGAVPSVSALARARAGSGLASLQFDPERCTVTRTADATIDVGAFGKGEALDRAAAAFRDTAWMIDLGGQISVGGIAPPNGAWDVAIADPRRRDAPVLTVRLVNGSLSTSGGSERDLIVGGERIAHHFDPRTGRPATFTGSVSVWHERGLVADMLSTALYVMGPEEGLEWAESRGIAACYLIPDGSKLEVRSTRRFRALFSEPE
jgi:thiamine biosynthesis lipoprotein